MIRGPEVGRRWDLGERATIGKSPDNDIVVVDATVSRQHLLIEQHSAGGFRVKDLGSTNGTYVEDTRVVEAYLRAGSEVRVGEVAFKLRAVYQDADVVPGAGNFGDLVGQSAPMRRVFALLERVAPTDATILITGETGTGKSAMARAIHDQSKRCDRPFVTVDCGAISINLIESELFGHEKGAFTGAHAQRRGALEICAGGTLFIDDLDDLPLDVQSKLLRALDAREITRVGSTKLIKLDLRVIAATKKNLIEEVAHGRFREDLYYRVSVVTFSLPALRERLEDVPALAETFLSQSGRSWDGLPHALRERLQQHSFPGNVRELRNLLERAMYLEGFDAVDPAVFPVETSTAAGGTEFRLVADYMMPFKEAKEALVDRFAREYLKRLVARTAGNIARAAREAGIDRKHLYALLGKYDLNPKGKEAKD
ncbi:MAG: sigma 54-interacting transcriptional regulator [Deltaproteobacteria bacterium]|nr:sigma 54-interacting transcriptional regulator [Deltaproteobacteria bacterium]